MLLDRIGRNSKQVAGSSTDTKCVKAVRRYAFYQPSQSSIKDMKKHNLVVRVVN